MTPEERKQLYIEIRQQGLYTSKNWEKNNLGENMVVLSKVICGF